MPSNKTSPSIAVRFSGRNGRIRLVETLLNQQLVAGDRRLANVIAQKAKIVEVKEGKALLIQGGIDNDIYFILSGSLSVRVNGRETAQRHLGDHVGEMALVDSTALRSASVIATEHSILAKISEINFNKLATTYPDIWRRIAVVLAQRLRERNRFHQPPRSQPSIFIASSKEGLKIAESIHDYLFRFPIAPRLWSQGVFEASRTAIEDLMKLTSEVDFAIIILTPDDLTASRGKTKLSPRDNAILELGLFMGAIGRNRTYMVSPYGVDIKIPTDLMGVTRLLYKRSGRGTLARRLLPLKNQIRNLITKYGPR